jgi:hypothetical protein
MFRKADEGHARAFQADGRAINEKVRLYVAPRSRASVRIAPNSVIPGTIGAEPRT